MKMVRVVFLVSVLFACALFTGNAHVMKGVKMRNLGGGFRLLSHEVKNELQVTSYISPPIKLQAGEIANTDPQTTMLNFPNFPISLKSFVAEVVDEYNNSVPLTEVYNHHWIVFMNNGQGNIGECNNLTYVFGVGAESRNTRTSYPDPYRLLTTGTEQWTANIHFIRTVDVPFLKQCIECHCGDVNNPHTGGSIRCCPDGSFCPTSGSNPPPPKLYFLKYTIEWNYPSTEDIPVQVYVFDSANCAIEFQIPPCTSPSSGCVHSQSKTYTFAQDTHVVYAQGHIHIGSINITLTNESTGEVICVGVPTYGNGTAPGNEKGYIVGISTCSWDTPLFLPAGTTIRYTSYYHSNPYHDGVMSLFYVAVVSKP